ncbi:toprim domain-containing protein [Nocardia sp. NPDC127526]|uniref:toprim domain-containing protein n=1 Tax=Nocardia sp. NPDC127526 TaxID=3345393 RepID=UPI003643EA03
MDSNRSFDTITSALTRVSGPGRRGSAWTTYLCPVHEADGRPHHPSLGVVYNHTRHRTVVKCFAGCPDEAVLDRLGLHIRDLFDHPRTPTLPRRPSSRPDLSLADRAILTAGLSLEAHKPDLGPRTGRPRRRAVYIYRWPDGRPAGRIIRVHTPHRHGHKKSFWQEHPTRSGWRPGGFPRLPFHLPEVLAAIHHSRDIYICEGEADVLTATHAGLTATCNAGGAQAWHPDHATWLAGAPRALIIADRDAPGYRHATRVAQSLTPLIPHLRILQARDGKDLTDHINAGHNISDLDPVPILDAHFNSHPAS